MISCKKKLGRLCMFLAVLMPGKTNMVSADGQKFLIQGKIPEMQSGEMILTTDTFDGVDTLARVPIKNGSFRMEGTLTEPVVAKIAVAKYEGGFVFLLDTDKPYTMELYQQKKSRIEGGKLQSELLGYQERVEKANAQMKELKEQIGKAVQLRHFKTKKELEDKLMEVQEEARKELEGRVDRNKDNLFAAYIQTAGWEQLADLNKLKERYNSLSEKARQTMPGLLLAARIAGLEKVDVGAIAPDFALPTPEGKEMGMYGIKGKVKILDFWASWCGPCRQENPNMVKLYQDFKDKGLEIVSISLDTSKDSWVKAIRKDGMAWTHLSSLEGWKSEVVKMYGVDAVPAIFVLDENNRILAKEIRGERLRSFVAERLKE